MLQSQQNTQRNHDPQTKPHKPTNFFFAQHKFILLKNIISSNINSNINSTNYRSSKKSSGRCSPYVRKYSCFVRCSSDKSFGNEFKIISRFSINILLANSIRPFGVFLIGNLLKVRGLFYLN